MMEKLKELVASVDDTRFNETIPKGILKLADSQIATVSFVFWLVYMAETDLNEALTNSWTQVSSQFSKDVQMAARATLQRAVDAVSPRRKVDINNLHFFDDKVKLYDAIFGRTKRTKLLYVLKRLRNDISHNRIDNLTYEGDSLSDRRVKEKIILDYMETAIKPDFSKSLMNKANNRD